jgi:hypothetical protein
VRSLLALAATASPSALPSASPSPAAEPPVDTSEFFAALVAFVVLLGLSVLLILRMRAANR